MKLTAAIRRQQRTVLYARREAIVNRWHRALLASVVAPRSAATVRQQLGEVTDRAIALLLADRIDHHAAQDLGAALVELGFHEPVALGVTQQVLGSALVDDLPAEQRAALHPRLLTLLSEVAVGFTEEVQEALLTTQDQSRRALLTEQQQVREALRVAEYRLRTVLDHVPLILFACDRAGVMTLAEGRGLVALERRPDDLVGRSVWIGGEVPQVLDNLRRALAGEAFTARLTVRGVVFEIRYEPVRDEGGAVVGVLGVALDITDRVRAEATARRYEVGLTAREHALLPLLAEERLTNVQIAAKLHVSPRTLKSHIHHIGHKLGVTGRAAIVAKAGAQGLVLPAPAAPPRHRHP